MVKDDPTDYFGLSGYTAEELKKKGYMVWMSPDQGIIPRRGRHTDISQSDRQWPTHL